VPGAFARKEFLNYESTVSELVTGTNFVYALSMRQPSTMLKETLTASWVRKAWKLEHCHWWETFGYQVQEGAYLKSTFMGVVKVGVAA
jgi:hypothetical protein